MKNSHLKRSLATLMIVWLLTTPVTAQTTAAERAASLRQQLAEVQTKQTELQTRLQQLDEDLKPENIEKSLAGIGSTRPEEVREQRRRQFEIEKKSVQTRLDQLATSRTRLETGILQADTSAYHSSAAGTEIDVPTKQPTAQPAPAAVPTVPQLTRRPRRNKPRPRRVRRGA
jgi:chromosome segregation ATPase